MSQAPDRKNHGFMSRLIPLPETQDGLYGSVIG